MNDGHKPHPPEHASDTGAAETSHVERWERAVEKAVSIERPPDGWPWQKRKGKKEGSGG